MAPESDAAPPPPKRRRRLSRVGVMLAMAIAMVAGVSTSAFASGTWSNNEWSGCSTSWTYNPYGGEADLHDIYSANTSNTNEYVVTNATAWVDNMIDCGPHGDGIYADHIDLSVTYELYGVGLNCSVSIPAAVSCSYSYTDVAYTFKTTCSTDVYGCKYTLGPLYFKAPNGGKYNEGLTMTTTATLYRSDGSPDTWSTNPV
jgi:hypothetical protein